MAKKAKYYVRPDGLHEAIRTINGKRVAFRGKTDREVDRKILEFKEQTAKGRPFPVVADLWFKEREPELSVSTYKVYDFAVKRLKQAFPGLCSEIRPLDVTRYIRDFEKRGYAKNTVQIELSVLKQIFSFAVLAGDIDVSPATEVRKSRNLPCKDRSALTEEQEAHVKACRTGDWWLLGMVMLYTGCRRGEVLALEWKDIDFKAGHIHIDKKLNYAYGNVPHLDGFTKNHKAHDVPLLAPLAAVLPRNRVGKIFPNPDGGYLTSSQLSRAWKGYCSDAGLVGVTPHMFRHSFATICFEAGLDPRTTASYLGDTMEVTTKVYEELRERKRLSGAEQINAYLAAREA